MAKKKELGIVKGAPITLPDGTIISKNANGETQIKTPEQQKAEQELDELLTDPFDEDDVDVFKRTLADVTVPSKQFNPVMLILSYTLWGLDENAIARFLDISEDDVAAITASDLFVKTRKEMLEAIRYAEASSIHGYITQKAKIAAQTVTSKLSSKKEDIALAAAKDILDRSGFRPVDRVEHSHRFEDELRIVHLNEVKEVKVDVDF